MCVAERGGDISELGWGGSWYDDTDINYLQDVSGCMLQCCMVLLMLLQLLN